ncbi:MAG: hypothetical protein FJZ85_07725 [Chloroflexi bacterium]|nr:hypothetical protein [Chloroflexota bacterium]
MRKVLVVALLLLVIPACFPAPAPAPAPTAPPVVVAFNASPAQILPGTSSTLLWNVTGATAVQIDQGIGSVALAGTQSVSPPGTLTYTLIASNSAGAVNQSVTVTVTAAPSPVPSPTPPPLPPPGLPVVVLFDISPNVIDKSLGQKATMRWDVNHATHVVIDPGFGSVSHSGTRILAPSLGGHTYVLKATNAAGTVTRTQHLDVRP